jgi:hypothetical protein
MMVDHFALLADCVDFVLINQPFPELMTYLEAKSVAKIQPTYSDHLVTEMVKR